MSVIFDGTTTLLKGEVVTASEEGSTVMINGEETSVTFAASDVLVNRVAVIISEAATLEAIFPPSIDVNGGAVSVVYDGSIAVGNGHPVVATMCGNSLRR